MEIHRFITLTIIQNLEEWLEKPIHNTRAKEGEETNSHSFFQCFLQLAFTNFKMKVSEKERNFKDT
jgi:hypothetical protein